MSLQTLEPWTRRQRDGRQSGQPGAPGSEQRVGGAGEAGPLTSLAAAAATTTAAAAPNRSSLSLALPPRLSLKGRLGRQTKGAQPPSPLARHFALYMALSPIAPPPPSLPVPARYVPCSNLP
ncbi:hypothetical protein E2C01_043816 [Portunus trituberculatus]|uniref:Uncharacterized protein n=1 Tax=Portunus trituberculatus TaxID=210409 RepID=A0A5B7FX45_PORTR|nr:hypothetical protein [Portunus trituberculatus]